MNFSITHLGAETVPIAAGADVLQGLTAQPKTLPAKYFYDERGSQIFEDICDLPEYYPTRTEAAILEQYADKIAHLTGSGDLVELGSGSSTKTQMLLNAYGGGGFSYCPIDVSAGMLTETARALADRYPNLTIQGLAGTYEQGLAWLHAHHHQPKTIAFLGSSLGNLNPTEQDAFFQQVGKSMAPGDHFLLGVDLHKATEILEPAYNDAQGVTAAFNLNMLAHLNWRFGGNFNLAGFKHRAVYNQEQRRIEMYLQSLIPQSVYLQALDLQIKLACGEDILTEISCKFDWQTMDKRFQTWGLKVVDHWTDANQWFGLFLARYQG